MTTDAVEVGILKLDATGSFGVAIEGIAIEIKAAGVPQLGANVWSTEELHAPLGCGWMERELEQERLETKGDPERSR